MAEFVGTYEFSHHSGDFKRLLKIIGVSPLLRELWISLKPKLTIVDNGDETFTMKTSTTYKNLEINFKLDEEFEEERLDGVKVKSIVIKGDGWMQHVQVHDDIKLIITYNLGHDQLLAKYSCVDIDCLFEFNKVE